MDLALRRLVEEAHEAMLWADRDRIIRYANPAMIQLVGCDRFDALVGQSVLDFYDRQTQQRLLEEILPAVLREGSWTGELALGRGDQVGVPIASRLFMIREGEEARLVLVADVSQHRCTDELLRAQHDLAMRLEEASLDEMCRIGLEAVLRLTGMDGGGLYLVDERGGLTLAVSAGLSPEFATDHGRFEPGSPHAKTVMAGVLRCFPAEELEQLLANGAHAEGLRAVVVVPIKQKGRVIGAINLASREAARIDPSVFFALEAIAFQLGRAIVHARTMEQLRESEERYRNFIANAGEGIYRIDLPEPIPIDLPQAELEQRIDAEAIVGEINGMAAQMYGYRPEEMVGKPARTFAPGVGARVVPLLSVPGHQLADVETTDVDRHGQAVHLSESATAIVEDGRLVRLWGTQRDITVRKRLEEQLRQSQKMEAIGRLAGGIAHDFNNLLTGINGYAEMMLESLGTGDPLRADLAEIYRAGSRAASLTNQLLAFSRKQVIVPKVLDPTNVIDHSRKMLERIIGEDIELVFRPDRERGRIKADPGQLDQILVNLAVNARDAMIGGGKLTIETASITLDEEYCRACPGVSPGEFVMLTVSDNGCGMSKEALARVFEPFYTTKEHEKGTGLGLAMVYGIVQQHHAFINVYSEVGIGTTFKIYFPRVFDEPDRIDKPPVDHLPGGTETILLVEDEEMVRALAFRVLTSRGYTVIEERDGGSAYLTCAKHEGTIHLLLTDVIMPRMNGRELYQRLLEIRPGLKVLYMSAYTVNVIAHHGILDAGTEFLQKPFTIRDLAHRVREVLDVRQTQPE